MKIGIVLTYLLIGFCIFFLFLLAYMVRRGTVKTEGTIVVDEEIDDCAEEPLENEIKKQVNIENNEEGE